MDDWAIKLLDEDWFRGHPDEQKWYLPPDTFSGRFIVDTLEAAERDQPLPLDLDKYRLTPSNFKPYDANRVLQRKVRWSRLVPLPPSKKQPCRVTVKDILEEAATRNEPEPDESDPPVVIIDDDDGEEEDDPFRPEPSVAATEVSTSPSQGSGQEEPWRSPPRREYQLMESRRIVSLICKHKAYRYTRGVTLWRQMEQSKVFSSTEPDM